MPAKCVNTQGTRLDGNIVPKIESLVTKYFSSHSQNERKGLCHQNVSLSSDNKAWMRPIMGLFSVSQLCPCVLTWNSWQIYSWQIQYCSKSGGWLTRLRQHKTSIFSSNVVSLLWNTITNYSNIKIVLPLAWVPMLMAENDARYFVYTYILHFEPRTGMLRNIPLDSSRRQRRIATVYLWKTETGKPYVIPSLFITWSVFSELSPINKTLFTHSWEWGMVCLLWVQDNM